VMHWPGLGFGDGKTYCVSYLPLRRQFACFLRFLFLL